MLVWGCSHIGRVRETNEDNYWIWHQQEKAILAVADGMGGHQAGEVASDIAIKGFQGYLEPILLSECYNFEQNKWLAILQEGVTRSNKLICGVAREISQYAGMGTTLTAALVVGNQLYFAHVGDSRIYVYRHGQLQLITKDHSLVQELVEGGLVAVEEARFHPRRHILTRAIGVAEEVKIDTAAMLLEPSDVLLLCTDGLTNEISDPELSDILCRPLSLDVKGKLLLERANSEGGDDNVTVILAQLESFTERI